MPLQSLVAMSKSPERTYLLESHYQDSELGKKDPESRTTQVSLQRLSVFPGKIGSFDVLVIRSTCGPIAIQGATPFG